MEIRLSVEHTRAGLVGHLVVFDDGVGMPPTIDREAPLDEVVVTVDGETTRFTVTEWEPGSGVSYQITLDHCERQVFESLMAEPDWDDLDDGDGEG